MDSTLRHYGDPYSYCAIGNHCKKSHEKWKNFCMTWSNRSMIPTNNSIVLQLPSPSKRYRSNNTQRPESVVCGVWDSILAW